MKKDQRNFEELPLSEIRRFTGRASEKARKIVVLSDLPEDISLTDLPGDGSPLLSATMEQRIAAAKSSADIAVHVLIGGEHALPAEEHHHQPLFLIVNKVDALVTPEHPPAAAIARELKRLHDAVALYRYQTDVHIFPCSPLSYFGAKRLPDELLSQVVSLGNSCRHETDILKALIHPIVAMNRDIPGCIAPLPERQKLLYTLSESLVPGSARDSAWPLFRLAMLLCWHSDDGLAASDLRRELLNLSGIEALRTELFKNAETHRIRKRRALRDSISKLESLRCRARQRLTKMQTLATTLKSSIQAAAGPVYDLTLTAESVVTFLETESTETATQLFEYEQALHALESPDAVPKASYLSDGGSQGRLKSIVFMGKTSNGKSSLLNAVFLSTPLSPMADLEATRCPVEFIRGTPERIRVYKEEHP